MAMAEGWGPGLRKWSVRAIQPDESVSGKTGRSTHAQSSQLPDIRLLDYPQVALWGNLNVFLYIQVNGTLYSVFPVMAV